MLPVRCKLIFFLYCLFGTFIFMMNNLLSDLRYRRISTALNAFSNANKCGLSSKRYSTEVGLSFD